MIEKFLTTDKVFHHPERLFAFQEGRIVKPVTLELHLTNKCNIKCNYCMYKDKRDKQTLSLEDAKTIIHKIKAMGTKGLTFSGGGEPTIHPNFQEIIQFTKEVGLDIGLITNGVEYIDPILEYLTWVRFSVDAYDKKTYKKIKGTDRFDEVIQNIDYCVARKHEQSLPVTIGFQMVLTENNYMELIPTLTLAEKLCVDYFQFRPLENGFYAEPIGTLIEQLRINILNDRHNKIHIVDTWYKWKELQDVKFYTDCPGIDFIGAIDAYGNYYMCCHHVQDEKACYGNLITGSIDEIFADRNIIQKKFNYKKCPIACRGAVMNRRLNTYGQIEHVNFI